MKHKQGQRLFRRPFWTAERAGFPLRPESYGYFSIFFARVQVFLCKLAHFIQLWSKIQQPVLIGQGIGPYGTRHSPSPRRNGACPSAAPRSSAHRGRPASPQARPCLKRRDREPVSRPAALPRLGTGSGPSHPEIRQRSLHTTASLRAAGSLSKIMSSMSLS